MYMYDFELSFLRGRGVKTSIDCINRYIGINNMSSYSFIIYCRSTSHVVFVCEPSNVIDGERARGSLHSIRRGSLDVRSVASDGLRRTSLAKLQGLPLEAPITKVGIMETRK